MVAKKRGEKQTYRIGELLKLLHEHVSLPQLHISVLWIPEQVGVGNTHHHRRSQGVAECVSAHFKKNDLRLGVEQDST